MDELGERARRVVENMNKGGLDVSRQDLNGLMNSFVRNNDATDQIWQFATLGGITRDVTNYNCYINAKLYGKQYERAFEVYREMQGAGIAGNTYTSTCLIRLYGATGDLIAARRVFDGVLSELGRGGPNVHVYNAMLDVLGTNGLMEEMRDLFLRMVGLADYSGGDVSGFGKDECRGGLERMGAIAPDRSTFHVLAKWHAQYWDLGTAKKYVELMAGGYGIQPVAKTFKVMVNVKTAMRDFQGCCELGVMMAERYDITPPGHIMRALERAGKVRKDMEDKIRESEEQASSLLSAFVK
ncbi:hypothetical protein EV174_001395 [Coemansia sp. RSA 2320]|nr:hypothetical protein EV174_001395 [Coemansia sp. RSA 2320]